MGASIGTEDGKGRGVNVELNIIPFIDLMSCLTAFLLVTAVWVNIAKLDVHTAGKARDQIREPPEDPQLSVLIEGDEIWIGVSRVDDFQRIPKVNGVYDYADLETKLKAQKSSAFFATTTKIEIAAASTRAQPVPYQALVATMDIAVKAGFADVAITDPDSLSARPHL